MIIVDLTFYNLIIGNFKYTTRLINEETKRFTLIYSVILFLIPIIGYKVKKMIMQEQGEFELSPATIVNSLITKCLFLSFIFFIVIQLVPDAKAQLNGNNTLGDFGLQSASQPDPGLYLAPFYYRYHTDTIRDSNGDRFMLISGDPGDITVNAFGGVLWWVSDYKILGANYGAMAVLPFSNSVLEAPPILGFQQDVGTKLSDIYIQPINLGWHIDWADFTTGIGIFFPTGNYEVGGDDNTGYGMWTFELYAGSTVYFDNAKSWHFATTAFYEIHSEKKDSDIRVGDILTLEGGLGKSFMQGALSVGVAYYAQWKITNDDFGEFEPVINLLTGSVRKHRVYAAGPEVTIPIPIKNKLIAFVNVRYLWEFGARTKTEGDTLFIIATFPLPSIPLN